MSHNRYDSPNDPGDDGEDGTIIGMPMKPHDPILGNTIGNFRVIRKHAEGGMGTIYLARHTVSGNRAAVKLLLPQFAQNQEVIARFFNEAKAAMAIKHPGVIEVYAFGNDDNGNAYIIMEFLRGENLQEHVDRVGKMDAGDAIQVAIGIADVLAAAHEAGIIHRDLKPENIFLVPDPKAPRGERVKLLDFGVAKLRMNAPMTRIGDLMGTPLYMAPEQCRGAKGVDHRADMYAVGCLIFRMVCGRPPFIGQNAGQVLRAQLTETPPSPLTYNGNLPQPLVALIAQLLEKEPDSRPRDMREVLARLYEMQKIAPPRDPSGAYAHVTPPPELRGPGGGRQMPLSAQMPAQNPQHTPQPFPAHTPGGHSGAIPATLPPGHGSAPVPSWTPQGQSAGYHSAPVRMPPGGRGMPGHGYQQYPGGTPVSRPRRAWLLWIGIGVAATALGAALAHLLG